MKKDILALIGLVYCSTQAASLIVWVIKACIAYGAA